MIKRSATASQEDLEQPVKGYQLLAVEERLDSLEKSMTNSIDRLSNSIMANPSVSPATLESTKIALEKRFEERLATEIMMVHKEYGPMKKQIQRVWRTAGGQVIGLVIQAIFMFFIFRNSQ